MSTVMVLGTVTEAERDEARKLSSRRNGLQEVVMILANNGLSTDNAMYERVLEDLSETNGKFHEWWRRVSASYGWPNEPQYSWSLDFDTREVRLFPRGGTNPLV